MKDTQDLDRILPQPIDDEIRQAGDDQLACALDLPRPTGGGEVGQALHRLPDTSYHLLGRLRVLGRDVSVNLPQASGSRVQPCNAHRSNSLNIASTAS